MRFPSRYAAYFAFGLVGISTAADTKPIPDLAEYKTVATAKITTAKGLTGPAATVQPGHLGVHIEPAGGKLTVALVEVDSPAAQAGIKPGDVIQSFAGKSVASLEALRDLLWAKTAGDTVAVAVRRNDQAISFQVKLSAASNPMSAGAAAPSRAVLGVRFGTVAKGVEVREATPGLPAAAAGIKVGDVITKIDSMAATTEAKARDYLSVRRPGETVKVELLRGDKEMTLDVQLAADSGVADQPSLASWDDRAPRVFRRDTYRLAVIPIAFSDVKPNEKITTGDWDKALFSTDAYKDKNVTGQSVYGSMNDYYREISCGKFKVAGKVFEGVTVGKKRSDYTSTPSKAALLTEAADVLLARDGQEALKDFDGIFFVYAGGRVQTQRTSIYWPHRSSFNHHGKRWAYFICPEGGERMGSISVVSHEFGHMLGLPDLYAKPDVPGTEGVGVWCTMSTGHGQDGKPLHFSAWCKEQLGWIQPAVIDPAVKQKLILAPIAGSSRECYKVLLRTDGSEYLLLENRVKKGFDRDLPGEGLLIWRVVDGRPILEESHGVGGPEGPRRFLGSVPYPSKANTAYTPYTTPAGKPTKPGGVPVHITNIQRLSDGRIAFHIGYEYL